MASYAFTIYKTTYAYKIALFYKLNLQLRK